MTSTVSEIQKLPVPSRKSSVSLEEALARRRSIRRFTGQPLTPRQLSQLLWAAQGVTGKGRGLRTAPSAGAIYPINVYAVTPGGFFLYDPASHTLEELTAEDLRPALAAAAFGQDPIAQAPVSIVICADYAKIRERYGGRGVRYADMEAGHVAQNIHLEAAALGLGSVPIGAFNTLDTHSLLRLPRNIEPVYIIPTGHHG